MEHERGVQQRQIAATDEEIGSLVYELYDLTEEGIAIVEESGKRCHD